MLKHINKSQQFQSSLQEHRQLRQPSNSYVNQNRSFQTNGGMNRSVVENRNFNNFTRRDNKSFQSRNNQDFRDSSPLIVRIRNIGPPARLEGKMSFVPPHLEYKMGS